MHLKWGMLPRPYQSGFGLLNVHGTLKPAYRAFQLLHGAMAAMHGAREQRLAVTTPHSPTDAMTQVCMLATRDASHARIFIFNDPISSSTLGQHCTATVSLGAHAARDGQLSNQHRCHRCIDECSARGAREGTRATTD